MSVESLFSAIKEASLPAVWSRGVALSRPGTGTTVIADSMSPGEVIARIVTADRPVHPKVTLWLEDGDEDWHCDCGDRNDPCPHVAAAVLALKAGTLTGRAEGGEAPGAGASGGEGEAAKPATTTQLLYRFTRLEPTAAGAPVPLAFERLLQRPGRDPEPFPDTLIATVGGIQAGRIPGPAIAASQGDFGVDAALTGSSPRGRLRLDRGQCARLLAALESCSHIALDGKPVRASARAVTWRARLSDDPATGGFLLERVDEPGLLESFVNGAALVEVSGSNAPVLRPLREPGLLPQERELFATRVFAASRAQELALEIIPSLEGKLALDLQTRRLPRVVELKPRAVVRVEKHADGSLAVVPTLLYGEPSQPPLATFDGARFEPASRETVPRRDPLAERQLARRLQDELNLQLGQLSRFEGTGALELARKLEQQGWETTGSGRSGVELRGKLVPRLRIEGDSFQLDFEVPGGTSNRADAGAVLRAWQKCSEFVPLLDGGWAELPRDWLARYGDRARALLVARTESPEGKLPRVLRLELAELAAETGARLPESLRALRERLAGREKLPDAELPKDLRAELRHYQRAGIDWLSLLRDSGLGALLADDMGLGKTLQALCAIRGRTLVVSPTSVLESWKAQLARFRPALRVTVYHGTERELDPSADVVLTTYGVLRMDRAELSAVDWGTVVLDEAQTIKNPESQVARAAFHLRGEFRLALTGTPIENRIDDLWSQFQFINPGLLGTREELRERAASDPEGVRARVRPFILRRLKREVAPELPPRTEIVLHAELSESESELYHSILAASRAEVLGRLEAESGGASVLAALEALLRLRQACCHPALVEPEKKVEHSAKIDLFLETLEESLASQHRSLVFSQWTALLDLIEPELRSRGIDFLRLDGSTRDRGALVERFQDPAGPPVFLISLKAGGTGLTLTAADHVFILDPWWNPAAEDQAADRAHRIGQTQPVLIHRLVARGTVEDRILELQQRKRELAGGFLEGTGGAISLTREDLLGLLG